MKETAVTGIVSIEKELENNVEISAEGKERKWKVYDLLFANAGVIMNRGMEERC